LQHGGKEGRRHKRNEVREEKRRFPTCGHTKWSVERPHNNKGKTRRKRTGGVKLDSTPTWNLRAKEEISTREEQKNGSERIAKPVHLAKNGPS